jgi:hypothetical protein
MRTLLAIPLGLLFLVSPAMAQHKITLSWTNSPDTNNTFVYRLTGPCPTPLSGFTKLTASPVTTATYTDSAVNAGTTYAYMVTAFLNNLESVPSNCISATVPVAPPTGLTISSVAILRQGTQDRLQADWTDTSGAATAFTIFGGNGQVLKQGSQTTTNGVYSFAILLPVQSGVFSVCDSKGCVSQAFTGI